MRGASYARCADGDHRQPSERSAGPPRQPLLPVQIWAVSSVRQTLGLRIGEQWVAAGQSDAAAGGAANLHFVGG
jgi:hypothetical protein